MKRKKNRNLFRNRIFDFLILALITIVLYGNIIHLWWTYDDPQTLKHAIRYSPLQYFFQPHIWQEYTPRFLTPLLLYSFDIDIFLFDLTPQWFYVHQLFIIWLCSIMVYLILKKWVQRPFAFLGAGLFLLGSPVAVIAQQLMTRHYVDGLLFALISLYLFVKSLEKSKIGWAYGSALVYALSMAAKELYVPLAFLLIALPHGKWKQRLKYSVPHFVLLLLYVGWRLWMLGTLWGGNDGHISARNVIFLPYNAIHPFFEPKSPFGIIAAVAVIGASIIFLTKNWKRVFFVLWVWGLILFPILPVAHSPNPRFFLVVWLAVALFLSFMTSFFWNNGLSGKIISAGLLLIVLLHTLFDSRRVWHNHLPSAYRSSDEGMFIFDGAGPNDLLRQPFYEGGHYFEGIQFLKRYRGIPAAGKWFHDDIYMCEHDLSGKKIWQYAATEGRLLDITGSIEGIAKAYCGRIISDAPLSIRANYSKNVASWELGPYTDGHYAFLTGDGMTKTNVPPTGFMRVHFENFMKFRIRYESPEGWITYSPDLTVRIQDNKMEINWERTGAGG